MLFAEASTLLTNSSVEIRLQGRIILALRTIPVTRAYLHNETEMRLNFAGKIDLSK